MFKRRRKTKTPELPEIYKDIWSLIATYLEWPEMLGLRAVCKDTHGIRELSLDNICIEIWLDCVPLEMILTCSQASFYRNDMEKGWPKRYARMAEFESAIIGDEGSEVWLRVIDRFYIPRFRGRGILYTLYLYFLHIGTDYAYNKSRIHEVARCGKTSTFIRAARISGYTKMPRPKNWDTFFT